MVNKSYTIEQSALLAQSIWRGKQVRKKYGIKQAPQNSLTDYDLFLVGNDPKIKGLKHYAAPKGKVAFVGTSGLRSLALISELSNKEHLPKLILIDNSKKVILFWKKLRTLVEETSFINKHSFHLAFRDFLSQNSHLFRDIPSNALADLNIYGTEYENQNPKLFMDNLIEKHGLNYVLSIIKHMSIISQSWADNTLFSTLKNIIELHGIETVYAYPSNIRYCVSWNTVSSVLKSIELLNPNLTIVTDLCPHHRIPEKVYLIPGKQKPKNKSFNQAAVIDMQLDVEERSEDVQLLDNDAGNNVSMRVNYNVEQDYDEALVQLVLDKEDLDLTIRPYIEQLIAQVEQLKQNRNVSTANLTRVLLATHKRLDNTLDLESYKNLAEMAQGATSPGMKILGGLMIGLGLAMIILGVIALITFGPLYGIIIGAGALTAAAGFCFFSIGTQKGLSRLMNDIAEMQSLSVRI